MDAAKTEPEPIRYRLREAVLGAVLVAMALATVLVEGRPRIAFVTFALIALVGLVNLEL
jgi:hypothetical protein